jgi:hypothetical protein
MADLNTPQCLVIKGENLERLRTGDKQMLLCKASVLLQGNLPPGVEAGNIVYIRSDLQS